MKLPRDLNGRALIAALCRSWGYHEVHCVGSHVVLETDSPSHQRVVVPDHHSLRVGTLAAILKAVADHKHVSRDDILASLQGR
jgi:predicted RNA binding protein YcfA (HicA-like mRNA interferase family)